MRFFIGLLFLSTFAVAQKVNNNYNYPLRKIHTVMKIDGKPLETVWDSLPVAKDLFQMLPMDTSKSILNTKARFCYDEKYIYVLIKNFNKKPIINPVESMRRDWTFGRNDNDLLFIDTFNDLTTGYAFGSNARGGQWDGLMYNGSTVNLSWDNKWVSEVSFDKNVWIWEAAIPFKTLRYKQNIKTWGMNFGRLDLTTTEKSSWTPIPRQFPSAALAYTGNLVWDNPPPKPGSNISLIPFTYMGVKKFADNSQTTTPGIGLDAKIGLTSALNMDLTVLPDFSQVEVDVQQTNLDRFELLFPERRQFFLENGDIFNDFGLANLRPFFSRRIGLNAPIYFGAKVSGKVTPNMRIGILDMKTGNDNTTGFSGSNYGVISVQQKVFKRSYIAAMYIDRKTSHVNDVLADYNRTLGLEYDLASANNMWKGKAFWVKTFSPIINGQNDYSAIDLNRDTKKLGLSFRFENVGKDVQGNEVGYVPRLNYYRVMPDMTYLFFPKKSKILSHGIYTFQSFHFDKAGSGKIESTNFLSYLFTFRVKSELTIWTARDFVKLGADFDPTNYANLYLPKGSEHTWYSCGFDFTSAPQNLFTYAASARVGGYYANSERTRLNGNVAYRFQPYAAITLNFNYNQLRFSNAEVLPSGLKNTTHNLWLVGPRIDLTLSNKLFFTNFVQYNNQTNNFNTNTRLQWRYSPASDLFLVYTDNYTADNFMMKDRAIVLKFNYWWNL